VRGGTDWIGQARYKEMWRALRNAVLNFQII
jgi:hypothetical protein